MHVRELYQKIPGIEAPWKVEDVELDLADREVRVHLKHGAPQPPCPVCGVASLSWQAVSGIQQRAVARGLARRKVYLPDHLGVDETSFQKRHEYVTVLIDQMASTVAHVADGRGRETLDSYFQGSSWSRRAQVKSVAMDMWAPHIAAVGEGIPRAREKIVLDKFHVAQHLSKAVDSVRRQENRLLLEEGDEQLKGTKYLWLKNPGHMADETWTGFASLRQGTLRTARAWAIKELAMSLWKYRTLGWARRAWGAWFNWAIRSQLEPIKKVAGMVKRHLNGILNAIVLGVTNARSEGINAKIQWITSTPLVASAIAYAFAPRSTFTLAALTSIPPGSGETCLTHTRW